MIRELKTLLVVARTGSFAAAGDQIGLTQGAVSLQMRRLEEHLGKVLFERTGRSASLNQAGQQVVRYAPTPRRMKPFDVEMSYWSLNELVFLTASSSPS